MHILDKEITGELFYTVYDKDWFSFSHTTKISLRDNEIDETLPDSQALCQDLKKQEGKVDSEGNGKYIKSTIDILAEYLLAYEFTDTGPYLMEKEEWIEYAGEEI